MNLPASLREPGKPGARPWLGAAAWGLGWSAMFWLDDHVDLANLALLLVLTSAVASLWLPAWVAALAGAVAVMAFNWSFVPPRGTFTVDLRQHALLLVAMLVVNSIVAVLMEAQRRQALRAQWHANCETQLRAWGETLRDAPRSRWGPRYSFYPSMPCWLPAVP